MSLLKFNKQTIEAPCSLNTQNQKNILACPESGRAISITYQKILARISRKPPAPTPLTLPRNSSRMPA